MADWFLIVSIVVAFILLLIAALYFLVHFQHPDDKNEAWFPKITVLLGFVLAGATVLLLPLDVANNEGYAGCDGYDTKLCGGLNMELFWDIFFWTIPVWVFLLIPFMTFFYEADDGTLMAGTSIGSNPKSRFCEAVKYEIFVIVIVGLFFVLGYLFLNDAAVPITDYNGSLGGVEFTTTAGVIFNSNLLVDIGTNDISYLNSVETNSTATELILPVSIPTFFAGFMSFVGWFFFALFGGVGLAAVPLDLILTFINRPRLMSTTEMADAQLSIRERVNELVDIGELLKVEREEQQASGKKISRFSKEGREQNKTLLEFKAQVLLLEEDAEDFLLCTDNHKKYNPLKAYFSLLCGFVSIILSITWVIQIAIYVLPKNPPHSFLNRYFQWFDEWFPLFGVLSVALYSVYLLLCAVKGCFKFGLRFLLFQLHPMKPNKTYMSSFMFNIGLILLCALPVVQLCTTAFSEYARYTNVYQVIGVQVEYLKFFRWFWVNNIFVISLLGVTALTTLYLAFCKKRETKNNAQLLRDKLKSRRL